MQTISKDNIYRKNIELDAWNVIYHILWFGFFKALDKTKVGQTFLFMCPSWKGNLYKSHPEKITITYELIEKLKKKAKYLNW